MSQASHFDACHRIVRHTSTGLIVTCIASRCPCVNSSGFVQPGANQTIYANKSHKTAKPQIKLSHTTTIKNRNHDLLRDNYVVPYQHYPSSKFVVLILMEVYLWSRNSTSLSIAFTYESRRYKSMNSIMTMLISMSINSLNFVTTNR